MVLQMIQSAFSALGLSSKSSKNFVWYMDSSASNHMTYSTDNLKNVQKYDGNMNIHIANSDKLPITTIGHINHPLPLKNVFYSPH